MSNDIIQNNDFHITITGPKGNHLQNISRRITEVLEQENVKLDLFDMTGTVDAQTLMSTLDSPVPGKATVEVNSFATGKVVFIGKDDTVSSSLAEYAEKSQEVYINVWRQTLDVKEDERVEVSILSAALLSETNSHDPVPLSTSHPSRYQHTFEYPIRCSAPVDKEKYGAALAQKFSEQGLPVKITPLIEEVEFGKTIQEGDNLIILHIHADKNISEEECRRMEEMVENSMNLSSSYVCIEYAVLLRKKTKEERSKR